MDGRPLSWLRGVICGVTKRDAFPGDLIPQLLRNGGIQIKRRLAVTLAIGVLLTGCGSVPPGPSLSARALGWGGCVYRLATKLPADDLGEKLGSAASYGGSSGAYEIYKVRTHGRISPNKLAFVLDGSAYEGIRTGQVFSGTDAIAQANHVVGAVFPGRPGTRKGVVGVGGPAPGRTIPAVLQTKLKTLSPYCSDTFRVTFVEWWSAKDFRSGDTGGSTLEHHWTFKVTSVDTTFLAEGGDFPPQDVR